VGGGSPETLGRKTISNDCVRKQKGEKKKGGGSSGGRKPIWDETVLGGYRLRGTPRGWAVMGAEQGDNSDFERRRKISQGGEGVGERTEGGRTQRRGKSGGQKNGEGTRQKGKEKTRGGEIPWGHHMERLIKRIGGKKRSGGNVGKKKTESKPGISWERGGDCVLRGARRRGWNRRKKVKAQKKIGSLELTQRGSYFVFYRDTGRRRVLERGAASQEERARHGQKVSPIGRVKRATCPPPMSIHRFSYRWERV